MPINVTEKMTDNEVIKALECCIETSGVNCGERPYCDNCVTDENTSLMMTNALDLINRLQAKLDEAEDTIQFADKELKKANTEIERLKSDVSVSRDAYMSMKDRYEYEKEKIEKAKQKCIGIAKSLETAKAEAYKECIEKVEERIAVKLLKNKSNEYAEGFSDALDGVNGELDNLLNELVGDK